MNNTLLIPHKHKTKMIAHRGLAGLRVENTLPSFTLAAKASHYGIEFDVHRTRDGAFIIHHDDDFKRIYDSELVIAENDCPTLLAASLSLGEENKMIHLSDILELCHKHNKKIILEIKALFSKHDIKDMLAQCQPYMEEMVIISFMYENLVLTRELGFKGPMQLLYFNEINQELIDKLIAIKADANIHHRLATKEAIALFHRHNIEVNAWTVNTLEIASRLIIDQIDYITTDILE
ncbi:MAG: glycerophosphodiester phosphodiesterase family protein [Acholeplasmataceae bacterium]